MSEDFGTNLEVQEFIPTVSSGGGLVDIVDTVRFLLLISIIFFCFIHLYHLISCRLI